MLAFIEIAVLVVVVAIFWGLFSRGRRVGERESVMERRVEAYMQTIRREGKNAELAAMTDLELKDLLLSGARNLKIDAERRSYVLWGAAVIGLIAAFVIATQDGWRGFGIVLGIAAVVVYGIGEYMSRRMREPLTSRGIDIERLRVE